MMVAVIWRAVLLLCTLVPIFAYAASEQVRVELNGAENQDNRCRLTFVIQNTLARSIDSFKLDLVVFNTEDVRDRRRMQPGRIYPGQRRHRLRAG
jgi:hypothetical protein